MSYCIDQHAHTYAAWAASRGASVVNCRFKVEEGRDLLESCGFVSSLSSPEQLPEPELIDHRHQRWRNKLIKNAQRIGIEMTHGVAAKLVNLYLKSRFVCGGHHNHPHVACLHPPIDSVMLTALAKANAGGFEEGWKRLQKQRWSKLHSHQYQTAINLIRSCMGNKPIWKIEEYWQGNQ